MASKAGFKTLSNGGPSSVRTMSVTNAMGIVQVKEATKFVKSGYDPVRAMPATSVERPGRIHLSHNCKC
jgi:hypothetical protein